MRTRHVFSCFCVVIFALFAQGASSRSKPPVPPKDVPASIGVVSTGFSFTLPDPKRPGKLLYDLRAASATGQSAADGFHGTLTSVWARLFQNGVATAILTAPRAVGGSANKSTVITGTGGVVVKSLMQPGTILTADTITWYATSNKMLAVGHVYYHNGQNGATMTGPRAVGDTRLKTLTISAGHGTAKF